LKCSSSITKEERRARGEVLRTPGKEKWAASSRAMCSLVDLYPKKKRRGTNSSITLGTWEEQVKRRGIYPGFATLQLNSLYGGRESERSALAHGGEGLKKAEIGGAEATLPVYRFRVPLMRGGGGGKGKWSGVSYTNW